MTKPTLPNLERRAVVFEVRASGEGTTIKGHAAVFNSASELMCGCFREVIKPGAFADALANYDTRALFNHDPSQILGRASAGTLRMQEDETGLAIEIDTPDTSCGRDLQVSMKRGDIKEMSFGFTVAEDGQEWTRDPDESGNWTRTISKFEKVYDVSPVTFPAYPDTDCALRSLDGIRSKQIEPPVADNYVHRLRIELEAAY